METMYDRLGDLLSETLEAGHVKYVKPSPKEEPEPEQENKASERPSEDLHEKPSAEKKKRQNTHTQSNYRQKDQPQATIIKTIPPELERAYRLLGISANATKDEIKKAYKDKLMYFHPDRHTGNAILEKVATDKTRQVMESYELILKYLEK
ncbi:MAG: DnaJ domain-containing protein [Treponema sp.]|nr:DnaJ domain-containing protein [Candidatus Treponema equi]